MLCLIRLQYALYIQSYQIYINTYVINNNIDTTHNTQFFLSLSIKYFSIRFVWPECIKYLFWLFFLYIFDWTTATTGFNPSLNNLGTEVNLHVPVWHNVVEGCDRSSLSQPQPEVSFALETNKRRADIRPFPRPS